jgi:hypothetical protein
MTTRGTDARTACTTDSATIVALRAAAGARAGGRNEHDQRQARRARVEHAHRDTKEAAISGHQQARGDHRGAPRPAARTTADRTLAASAIATSPAVDSRCRREQLQPSSSAEFAFTAVERVGRMIEVARDVRRGDVVGQVLSGGSSTSLAARRDANTRRRSPATARDPTAPPAGARSPRLNHAAHRAGSSAA